MEEEKSAFAILKEYAESRNRQIEISDQEHAKIALHPGRYHKRACYIPENKAGNLFYYCFSDSKFTGDYSHFCSVFFALQAASGLEASLHRKDIIDRISRLGKKVKVKTGHSEFDSKVVIKTNDGQALQRLLTPGKVKDVIIKIFDANEAYRVVINEVSPGFVPELKNQSTMGILNPRSWIFEPGKIDELFALGRELKEAL